MNVVGPAGGIVPMKKMTQLGFVRIPKLNYTVTGRTMKIGV